MTSSTAYDMDFRTDLRRLTTSAAGADADTLRRLGALPQEEIQRALADVFADGDAGLPDALVRVLTGRADSRTVQVLLPLLRSENPRVRNSACAVLERVGGEAPDPVLEFSRDPDPRMRVFATSILGRMPPAASVGRLMEMLSDNDPTVVDCSIAALGTLRAEPAVDLLAEFLVRSRSWMRLSALDAPQRIGTPPAIRAMLAALPAADAETASILRGVLARLEPDAPPDLAAEIRAARSRPS